MQVECTKKLLDYIGVQAEAADERIDPVFRWSTNLIQVNRRRTIVVAHDSSRYGFVLYGIKAKDIHNLGDLLLDGIRTCLELECIDPDLIDRYLSDCGTPVVFTKSAGRTLVSRLNQLCTRVTYFADDFTVEHLFQKQVLAVINDDYIRVRNNPVQRYFVVYEKLGEDLSSLYGASPYRCRAAEFEVELELESTCTRRVIVPLDYTFRQFHHVLQTLFCWQGYHLHDFWIERHPNGRLKHTLIGSPREFDLEEESTRDDTSVCLSEIFPKYGHIIYNYDFGDDWIHHIRLVSLIDEHGKNHAVCLAWEGEAPPEDAGGPGGYTQLLQILSDPTDPDHAAMKRWSASMLCRPFDLDRINRQLRGCARRCDSMW